MNNTTDYVGMDVHKESFTLCAYTLEKEKGSYSRRTPADYKEVLKYLEFLRTVYGNDTRLRFSPSHRNPSFPKFWY